VVHENVSEEIMSAGGAENVVRFEGRFDDTIIWLDPATGEDLVTFTSNDIDQVFDEIFSEQGFVDEVGDAGDQASEIWFSVDGVTWALLQSSDTSAAGTDSFASLAGVGDDELLVRSQTFVEPPAELFSFEEEGREPTPEEEEALDAWFAESQQDSLTWTVIPVG